VRSGEPPAARPDMIASGTGHGAAAKVVVETPQSAAKPIIEQPL